MTSAAGEDCLNKFEAIIKITSADYFIGMLWRQAVFRQCVVLAARK
ncbi:MULTISPECIES: hypothetical protein [Aquitalea]|nr:MULTISPECIES: hypothetical protein [Aquitalea]